MSERASASTRYRGPMIAVEILFWASLAAILWTHVGYPLAAALLASLHTRHVRKADVTPSVTVIIPAHDEEDVIAARLDNLLALDYPHEQLEIVVASDASTDGTDAIVSSYAARDPRIRLLAAPARRQARRPEPRRRREHARRRRVLGRELEMGARRTEQARPQSRRRGRVVRLREAPPRAPGRHEPRGRLLALRALAARERVTLGSITGGNGAIYAVRRTDYVSHRFGQDLGLPDAMVKNGKRAVYEPEAVASEKPAGQRRGGVPPQGAHVPVGVAAHVPGPDARRASARCTSSSSISHRVLRYTSGLLHVVLLATSIALASHGLVFAVVLAGQLLWLVLAALGRLRVPIPGAGLAYYYFLVTWATIAALVSYLRFGVSPHWERAEGAR